MDFTHFQKGWQWTSQRHHRRLSGVVAPKKSQNTSKMPKNILNFHNIWANTIANRNLTICNFLRFLPKIRLFYKAKNAQNREKMTFFKIRLKQYIRNRSLTISRKWVNLQVFGLIMHVTSPWHPINVSQPNIAILEDFGNVTSTVVFVAFVAFLGNTMLFFRKFMKNRTFFIPWSLS